MLLQIHEKTSNSTPLVQVYENRNFTPSREKMSPHDGFDGVPTGAIRCVLKGWLLGDHYIPRRCYWLFWGPLGHKVDNNNVHGIIANRAYGGAFSTQCRKL